MGKLSDKEFWGILRENGGIAARTVRAIKAKYGIDITRQSVSQRAKKRLQVLADIEEANLDRAEETLFDVLITADDAVKLRAATYYLDRKGRKRGYIEKSELNGNLSVNLATLFVSDPAEQSEGEDPK
jgi:hypothetical protein